MNEPTRSVNPSLWKGEERSIRSVKKMQQKNQRIGGGVRRREPQNLAFVMGTRWLVAAAQTLPGCLEKLLSSLTPFKKQEENISSV
jgi:hypothetical protein